VTTDGGYSSPSQAGDGNIVALHNGQFVHLDRHGNLLSPPVNGLQGVAGGAVALGPWDPRVSPDDSKIAYDIGVVSTIWEWTCNCDQQTTEYQTLYTDVGQFTDPSVYGVIRDYSTPSWIDDQHTLLTATGSASTSSRFICSAVVTPIQPTSSSGSATNLARRWPRLS
jgi:hypothetical protein